jgi:hypothetical protein
MAQQTQQKKGPSLADLLEKHKDVVELRPSDNRIVCKLTGYEMPARADVVHGYLTGAKFRKTREWYTFDYSEFLPLVVPDSKDNKLLYCRVTKESLPKIPEKVHQHVNGKRYARLKKEWEVEEERKTKKSAEAARKKAKWEERVAAEAAEGTEQKQSKSKTKGKAEAADADIWVPEDHVITGDGPDDQEGGEEDDDESDHEDLIGSDHDD